MEDSYMVLRNGKKINRNRVVRPVVKKVRPGVDNTKFKLFDSWMEAAMVTSWILLVSGIFLMKMDLCPHDVIEICDDLVERFLIN